jgi:hypothetical protein
MADDQSAEQADNPQGKAGSNRFPPYIPFPTFLTLLTELKSKGLPPQIDRSVLRRFAGGMQNQLKMALRSLGLIDGDKPTPKLAALVDAHETSAFEPLLLDLLKAVYPFVFELDLMSATPTMFADSFKSTGAKEDVSRKMRTFFLHAAKRAGVPLGARILTGSVPRSPSSAGARRKPKAAKVGEAPAQPAAEVQAKEKRDADTSAKNHPLVQGLLMTLPQPGKQWTIEARVSWLRMAGSIFENIYIGKGSVAVEIAKPNDNGS